MFCHVLRIQTSMDWKYFDMLVLRTLRTRPPPPNHKQPHIKQYTHPIYTPLPVRPLLPLQPLINTPFWIPLHRSPPRMCDHLTRRIHYNQRRNPMYTQRRHDLLSHCFRGVGKSVHPMAMFREVFEVVVGIAVT